MFIKIKKALFEKRNIIVSGILGEGSEKRENPRKSGRIGNSDFLPHFVYLVYSNYLNYYCHTIYIPSSLVVYVLLFVSVILLMVISCLHFQILLKYTNTGTRMRPIRIV